MAVGRTLNSIRLWIERPSAVRGDWSPVCRL